MRPTPKNFVDLTGRKFARLTVVEKVNKKNRVYWKCECDCGKIAVVRTDGLTSGHAKSCGCLQKEIVAQNVVSMNTTHGMSKHRFYNIYMKMKSRCLVESDHAYRDYGGRGITVSSDWMEFEKFYNDMYPSYIQHCAEHGVRKTTIDRIDNNGGYSKANCRWATPLVQVRNRRPRREGAKVNQYK